MEQMLSDLIFALWDELILMQATSHKYLLAMFVVTWMYQSVTIGLLLVLRRGE